jgi:hypothetical protein
MSTKDDLIADFYDGLTEIAKDAFPRECSNCGRIFQTIGDFITQTQTIRGHSGLTEYSDRGGRTAIYLFRNCVCGSTLMEMFRDRRDPTERGARVREKFAQLLEILAAFGLDVQESRRELLRVLHGDESEILNQLGFKIRRGAKSE